MSSLQEKLNEFHVKFGHWIGSINGINPPHQVIDLRNNLIYEECHETTDALMILREFMLTGKCPGILLSSVRGMFQFSGCGGGSDCPTCAARTGPLLLEKLRLEVLDGIADSVYVLVGTAVTLGMDFHGAFKEVHRSNMTKTAPENPDPTAKYSVKTPKGPNFTPPDLRPFIWPNYEEKKYEQVSGSFSEATPGTHHGSPKASDQCGRQRQEADGD